MDDIFIQTLLYLLKKACFSSEWPQKELLMVKVQGSCVTFKCFPNDP